MEKIEDQVNRFLSFFEDKFEEIKAASHGNSDRLFKKILYVGLLDTLSKTTSFPRQRNRERFTSFIQHFSCWKDSAKISLPHLVGLVSKIRSPEFSEIREFAFSEIEKWKPSTFPSLVQDPDLNQVKNLWPKSIPKPLDENLQIDFLQHTNLFYKYRSSLVHELREPGYGFEMKNDVEPYYHQHHSLDTDVISWELVYPLGFYEKICTNSIKALRSYYIKERINPYNCFTFGSYFIEQLNI